MKCPIVDDAELRRLLEEHRLCSVEVGRLTKMKPKLEAERDQIVKSGDATAPAVFAKCSDLQLRLDLISMKLRQIEARLGEINTEFRPAFDSCRLSLSSAVQTVYGGPSRPLNQPSRGCCLTLSSVPMWPSNASNLGASSVSILAAALAGRRIKIRSPLLRGWLSA